MTTGALVCPKALCVTPNVLAALALAPPSAEVLPKALWLVRGSKAGDPELLPKVVMGTDGVVFLE